MRDFETHRMIAAKIAATNTRPEETKTGGMDWSAIFVALGVRLNETIPMTPNKYPFA